jgi:biopolymer transport protein ExbD
MAMATHDVTDTNVMGDINVTPMVDVMLVLLIIFMVVTPAITAGFQAKLPDGAHLKQREIKEEERTMLGIDGNGDIYLNKKPVPGCKFAQRQGAGKASCDAQLFALLQPSRRSRRLRTDARNATARRAGGRAGAGHLL